MSDRLLIIHMDDIGLTYAANEAAKELFLEGAATSASIMVPCSYALEFIRWSKENPQYDMGIHSTVTSEWEKIKWRPLSSAGSVISLVGKGGFMVSGQNGEMALISAADYKEEARRQIETAKELGLEITHLDNHMWPVLGREDILDAYLELAADYGLIPNLPSFGWFSEEKKAKITAHNFHISDSDFTIGESQDGFYRQLAELKEGLNVLTVHPVLDTREVRSFLSGYEARVREYEILLDPETKKQIKKNGIRLVSWGDLNKVSY